MHTLGQTNKGRQSVYLDKCKKVVYLGYHRFLPNLHPVRKKGKHFKRLAEPRRKPVLRTGEEVFGMVKDLEVIFGKGPGSLSQKVIDPESLPGLQTDVAQ